MEKGSLDEELLQVITEIYKTPQNKEVHHALLGGSLMLRYLYKYKNAAYPKDISDALALSTPRTAALLNKMQKKGYINREIDLNDRRQVIVTLTESGHAIAQQLDQQFNDYFIALAEFLGVEDTSELIRLLTRFREFSEIIAKEKTHKLT